MNSLLMIGCGHMGQAMLTRWLEMDVLPKQVVVVKPSPLPNMLAMQDKIHWHATLDEVTMSPAAILLAVKPQHLPELLPALAHRFGTAPLYISIAAGCTLAFYRQMLGDTVRIVRAMPNTPVMIGEGITTLITAIPLDTTEQQPLDNWFNALGDVYWLEDETLMDTATAIAGSGPAYVYLFMEALAAAGTTHGLPDEMALQMAIQTVHGSAQMAQQQATSKHPHILTALREQVTSKGGTTAAALQQLMDNPTLFTLMDQAVQAAIDRARRLSTESHP